MLAAFSLSDASSCVSVMSSSKHLKLQDHAVCPNRCLSLPIQNKSLNSYEGYTCICWSLKAVTFISSDKYFIKIEYKYKETADKNTRDNIWYWKVSNVFYTLMPTMKYCNYITLKERLILMMQSIMNLSQPFYFVGFEVCGFYVLDCYTENDQNSVGVRQFGYVSYCLVIRSEITSIKYLS